MNYEISEFNLSISKSDIPTEARRQLDAKKKLRLSSTTIEDDIPEEVKRHLKEKLLRLSSTTIEDDIPDEIKRHLKEKLMIYTYTI